MLEDIELGAVERDMLGKRKTWVDNVKPAKIYVTATTTLRRSTGLSTSNTNGYWNQTKESVNLGCSILTTEELICRGKLIALIISDQPLERSLRSACDWYVENLQYKIKSHWHMIVPALAGIEDNSLSPKPGDLVIVYEFILFVAKLLRGRENLGLADVVDELGNNLRLKPQIDEERAVPFQLAFATMGWLTMFFESAPKPQPTRLETVNSFICPLEAQHQLRMGQYSTSEQDFDLIDQPFCSLLAKLGVLMPGVANRGKIDHSTFANGECGEILLQAVCFNTIQQNAQVNVEWVDSIGLHLELDSLKKTLKIFRFPSFCRLMMVEKDKNLLSRLLDDHAAAECEFFDSARIPTDEFFAEMIRSYRLLFGQDDRSWKACAPLVAAIESPAHGFEGVGPCDPLLRIVCGQSSLSDEARGIYSDLRLSHQASYYRAELDFPFLGKRLLDLQHFVKQCQPSQNLKNVMQEMKDRGDLAGRFNLKSNQLLVIFATLTILLMIITLFFQIWQVMLAKQQLQQGN